MVRIRAVLRRTRTGKGRGEGKSEDERLLRGPLESVCRVTRCG